LRTGCDSINVGEIYQFLGLDVDVSRPQLPLLGGHLRLLGGMDGKFLQRPEKIRPVVSLRNPVCAGRKQSGTKIKEQ